MISAEIFIMTDLAVSRCPKLRSWQERLLVQIADHVQHLARRGNAITVIAAPATGKTTAAIEATERLHASGAVERVVIVSPYVVISHQWYAAAAMRGLSASFDPLSAADVLCLTYAGVVGSAEALRDMIEAQHTLVILDECHHQGEELTWSNASEEAFTDAFLILSLTGTPERTDEKRIPHVSYRKKRSQFEIKPDFSYTVAEALKDGYIAPTQFVLVDCNYIPPALANPLTESVRLSDIDKKRGKLPPVGATERTHVLNQLRRNQLVISELIDMAAASSRERCAASGQQLKTLFIAADQDHARQVAKLITAKTGTQPYLIISDDSDAHALLREFATNDAPLAVAVQMCGEGFDAPKIKTVVYLSNIKTELFFMQVVGRGTRRLSADVTNYVYMLHDPRIVDHVRKYERWQQNGLGEEVVPSTQVQVVSRPLHLGQSAAKVNPTAKKAARKAAKEAAKRGQLMLFDFDDKPAAKVQTGAPAASTKKQMRQMITKLIRQLCRWTEQTPRQLHGQHNRWQKVKGIEYCTVDMLRERIDWLKEALNEAITA